MHYSCKCQFNWVNNKKRVKILRQICTMYMCMYNCSHKLLMNCEIKEHYSIVHGNKMQGQYCSVYDCIKRDDLDALKRGIP